MAVRIRLTRIGAKKHPFYRIVVMDGRKRRDGEVLEILGTYDPMTEPPAVKLDLSRVDDWLGKGAQPSEPAARILRKMRRQAAAAEPAT